MRRGGGGLYSNFVSVNDSENRPYRGAEIPPPSNLTGRQGGSRNYGGVPPPANLYGSSSSSGPGVNKQGYSTINSISAGIMGYSPAGVNILLEIEDYLEIKLRYSKFFHLSKHRFLLKSSHRDLEHLKTKVKSGTSQGGQASHFFIG